MQFKITDPNAHSLIEVEITLHPEALRQALIGRRGWAAGWLHAIIIIVALYFAIAFEITLPRYWLALHLHPLPLVTAYIACRYGSTRGGLAAVFAAICYAGYQALALPHQCAIVILATLLPALLLGELPALRKCGWRSATFVGALASFIFCIGELCACLPMPTALFFRLFAREVCLAALLNAIVYAPVFYLILDFLTHPEPLFSPAKSNSAME